MSLEFSWLALTPFLIILLIGMDQLFLDVSISVGDYHYPRWIVIVSLLIGFLLVCTALLRGFFLCVCQKNYRGRARLVKPSQDWTDTERELCRHDIDLEVR